MRHKQERKSLSRECLPKEIVTVEKLRNPLFRLFAVDSVVHNMYNSEQGIPQFSTVTITVLEYVESDD
jgi:hypothetical protein